MFCKNCGTELPDNAKFCTSCGTKVDEVIKTETNQGTIAKDEVPWQLKQNDNYFNEKKDGKVLYQKDAFKGKQWSSESGGSISFGSKKKQKSGFFGKIIKFGIIAVVLIVAYVLFFVESGPITNIQTADAVNVETHEPIYPTDLFDDSVPVVYLTFETNDLEVGDVIQIDWYKADDYMTSVTYTALESNESLAFYLNEPVGGWSLTSYYYADIYLGEDLIDTAEFSFEE